MTQLSAHELGEHVRQLLALAAEIQDQAERRKLASRAFALAQQAEAMQRDGEQTSKATSVDPSLKTVTESNIQRFVGQLYVETDGKMRKLYRDITLQEERWYGIRQERLTLLMRLLRDCDGRITQVSQRARASAVPTDGADHLMDNLLDTQSFLLESLCDELVAEI